MSAWYSYQQHERAHYKFRVCAFTAEPLLTLNRHDPPSFTAGGPPSSVRIRCTVTRKSYTRRRASAPAAARFPTAATRVPAGTFDFTFYVYDPALFLRYDESSRAVQTMLSYAPLLAGVDLASENWQPHFRTGHARLAHAPAREAPTRRRREVPLHRAPHHAGPARVQRARGRGARLRRDVHAHLRHP